jgi:hypothetical protein
VRSGRTADKKQALSSHSLRSAMRVIFHKTIATTLAGLLAALSCGESSLHAIVHGHAPATAACRSHSTSSGHEHFHSTANSSCTPDSGCPASRGGHEIRLAGSQSGSHQLRPLTHDPETCVVCRFLALRQLADPPQDPVVADTTEWGRVAGAPSALPHRTATFALIRGPPAIRT